MHNARFLGGVSRFALMRPEDGTGAGTAASEEAAAAAAAAVAAGTAAGEGDGAAAGEAGGDGAVAEGAAAAKDGDKAKPGDGGEGRKPPGLKDVLPDWAADEIKEARRGKAQAKEEAERERAARRAAEELIEHLKKGNAGASAAVGDGAVAAATVETAAARATGQPPNAEKYNADVLAAAERVRFNEACNDVLIAGTAEFKDFEKGVGVLNAANVLHDEFLMDVLAIDKANAHKVLYELAQDANKARRLAALPSRQRIAELVRLTSATKPAQKRETSAPAPIPGKVAAVASADEGDLGDNVPDDDTWSERWNKKYIKTA